MALFQKHVHSLFQCFCCLLFCIKSQEHLWSGGSGDRKISHLYLVLNALCGFCIFNKTNMTKSLDDKMCHLYLILMVRIVFYDSCAHHGHFFQLCCTTTVNCDHRWKNATMSAGRRTQVEYIIHFFMCNSKLFILVCSNLFLILAHWNHCMITDRERS